MSHSTYPRVFPSTPAVLDPRFLLIRSHATVSVARSHTRLKRSPNLFALSAFVHRCSFRWISSTRSLASSTLGSGMSLFNGMSPHSSFTADLLSPFALWPVFPTSDYYGDSVPQRSFHRPWVGPLPYGVGAESLRFSRSPSTIRRGRCPATLLQHRFGYIAVFAEASPAPWVCGDGERTRHRLAAGSALCRPISIRLGSVDD